MDLLLPSALKFGFKTFLVSLVLFMALMGHF